MTFQEAAVLARQGIKVTHEYFSENEYLTIKGNFIVFEDGATIFVDEWAKGKDWINEGWSEYETKPLSNRTGIDTNFPIIYENVYHQIERFLPKEKEFKCKGKHRYELITNGNWACTCGKTLNN